MNRRYAAMQRIALSSASRSAEAAYSKLERNLAAAKNDEEREAVKKRMREVAKLSNLGNY
jgi:F0F1-type ATP synthase epsilon subunit